MDALAGPLIAAALLLVAGGVAKAWDPADTARALRGLGLPMTSLVVRLIAVAEVACGIAAVVAPGRGTAAAVAAWYLAFTVVVALALRSDKPLATCGCFAGADTPPTVAHLAVVALAAASATGFAVRPAGDVLATQPAYGVPFLAFTALTAWFGYLVMSRLAVLR